VFERASRFGENINNAELLKSLKILDFKDRKGEKFCPLCIDFVLLVGKEYLNKHDLVFRFLEEEHGQRNVKLL
jgi:hypothetical protein